MEMGSSDAILVRDACKSLGSHPILQNLHMRVPKGSIYGLLGASGCGKTTLLKCIAGVLSLDSGEIRVLGRRPGSKGSGVPGSRIGFMPQQTALVEAFTVKDTIYYFGRIFNMNEGLIEERFRELSRVLDLPDERKFINACSGGQQRRISLASCMVHMPELLVLDEPTVGIDPILRETIWTYLLEITAKNSMAVIVTTHYIDEARHTNVIGLMRGGRLLAEETPSRLLENFQTDSLEEVFLALSQRQEDGNLAEIGRSSTITDDEPAESTSLDFSISGKRLYSLIDKNLKQLYRNKGSLAFVFVFPVIVIAFFLICVGADMKRINVAIVNHEGETSSSNCFQKISHQFLDYLNDPMINKIQYSSLTEALRDFDDGYCTAVLFIPQNFSSNFMERVEDGRYASAEALHGIDVTIDFSNQVIGNQLKIRLGDRFLALQEDLFNSCDMNAKLYEFLKFEEFYGKGKEPFTAFFVPPLVITLMFYLMMIIMSEVIIMERKDGLWDRSIVAGVTTLELSLSHVIIQGVTVALYSVYSLVVAFVLFRIEFVGSLWVMALLTFFEGLTGMSYGFFVSAISHDVVLVGLLNTSTSIIIIILSGLMWPVEAMPYGVQYLSMSLPFAQPIFSFRDVMSKGWHLLHLEVLFGLGVQIAWIVIFAVLYNVILKLKR